MSLSAASERDGQGQAAVVQCGDLDGSSRHEWLVTDGLGGFAMGTVSGLRTRRYHGLLVAAVSPAIGRMVGLSSLDATVVINGQRTRLACDEWASGTIDPRGHEHLVSFALVAGVPRWHWQIGDVVIEREVAMARGSNIVGVVHRLLASPGPVTIEIEALGTWRDVHGERHAWGEPSVDQRADGCTFEQAFHMRAHGWRPAGVWYIGVHHREEAARGLAPNEDVWLMGRVTTVLNRGDAHETLAWTEEYETAHAVRAVDLVDHARDRYLAGGFDHVSRMLAHAADQFIVTGTRGITGIGGVTVVAGYPWFGGWSRDSMTSYEGLFLETGRVAEGLSLLRAAARSLSEGMLANTADGDGIEYNTVDAALWFLHAVDRHRTHVGRSASSSPASTGRKGKGDPGDLGVELLEPMLSVIDHYRAGTRFGIRIDPTDGLVTQGADGWALTWMDARLGTYAVTPRIGKPVEINALWINGLAAVISVLASTSTAGLVHPRLADLRALHEQASSSFVTRFVRTDGVGLYDVIDGPSGDDTSVRPNQLLAVSLPHAPLRPPAMAASARAVVDACGVLVTPLGLRSLSPEDPAYQKQHRGDAWARDHAYHQGTVWPWLIGPYVDACRVIGKSTDHLLDALIDHFGEWGIGSVSETADGDAPHHATGCPFQAWSVAELIRVTAGTR